MLEKGDTVTNNVHENSKKVNGKWLPILERWKASS